MTPYSHMLVDVDPDQSMQYQVTNHGMSYEWSNECGMEYKVTNHATSYEWSNECGMDRFGRQLEGVGSG